MRREAYIISPGSLSLDSITNDILDAVSSVTPAAEQTDFKVMWGPYFKALVELVLKYYHNIYKTDTLAHIQEIKSKDLEPIADRLVEGLSRAWELPVEDGQAGSAIDAVGADLTSELEKWHGQVAGQLEEKAEASKARKEKAEAKQEEFVPQPPPEEPTDPEARAMRDRMEALAEAEAEFGRELREVDLGTTRNIGKNLPLLRDILKEKFSAPGTEGQKKSSALIAKNSEYDKTKGAWDLDRDARIIRRRKNMIANALADKPAVPYVTGDTLVLTHNGSLVSGVLESATDTDYTLRVGDTLVTVPHEVVVEPGMEGMF
jgi:hypothetical protein